MKNLDNLIKQLNKLPKEKLKRRKDYSIRLNLYKLIIRNKTRELEKVFIPKQFKFVPAIAVILLIILVSVPGYAYASSKVTQGHALYPIKKGIETIEISLAQSDIAKVKKYVKMAERRLDEAETLSGKDNSEENMVNTINEAMENSFEADLELGNIFSEKEIEKMEKVIDKAKAEQGILLATIAQNVGVTASETVIDSVALALETTNAGKNNKEELNRGQTKKIINTLPEAGFATTTYAGEVDEATNTEEFIKDSKLKKAEEKNLQKIEQKKHTHEIARESLSELISRVEGLKEELQTTEYEEDDVNILFERLDKRINKAQEFIEEDKLSGFEGILQSTSAISNNAKHFIKTQKDNSKKNKSENTEDENNEINNKGNSNKINQGNKNNDR